MLTPIKKIIYFTGKTLVKGYLVERLPTLQKAFTISFEINPSSVVAATDSNIIHLTTGGSCCGTGSRVPAVFLKAYTTKLVVCTAIDNHSNRCFTFNPIPFNHYTKVEITQQHENYRKSYMFRVKIGGEEVLNVTNSNAKSYKKIPCGRKF